MEETKINKIIIYSLLLFMPLSCYQFPKFGITYGDFVLFITLFLMMLNIIKGTKIIINNKNAKLAFGYFIFIIMSSTLSFLTTLEINILSWFRYILYIVWCICATSLDIKKDYLIKKYKIFGMIFAVYAILQTVIFISTKKILPADPFKTIFGNSLISYYNSETIIYYISGQLAFRAYSLFLEPAYFAMYEMPLLLYLCNNKNNTKFDKILIILIIIAMFCARTITGIILSLGILFLFQLKKIKYSKKNMIIFVIIVLTFFIFSKTQYFQKLLNLVVTEDGVGVSLNNRIENYSSIFQGKSVATLLFGSGLWTETNYLPSLGRIFVSFGIIGAFILSIYYFYMFEKIEKINKKILVLFILSFVGTNSLFNITFVLCFTLILLLKDEEK